MTEKTIRFLALVKHQGAEFILPGAAASEGAAEQALHALFPDAELVAALAVSHYIDASLLRAAQNLHDAVKWERDTEEAMATLARCITQSETRSLGVYVDYLSSQPFASPVAVAA